jgi:catechol 2,3-dioxygenase
MIDNHAERTRPGDTPRSTITLSTTSIHPDTGVGAVRLTVSDLNRSREFYENVLGLAGSEREDGTLELGALGQHPLVELSADAAARPLDRRATGLFHLAILQPSRHDLALALRRIAEARWPLDGASDHLVSEALYLSDPDGIGIEIYHDRPREVWPHKGEELSMATLPLNLRTIIDELDGPADQARRTDTGTRMGHVHLQVSDVDEAEGFYSGVLGFDVMVRGYPGALFLSAGGYHHHIGLNTWHSAGSEPPAPGSIGLRSFDVLLPGHDELERVVDRVKAAGVTIERADGAAFARDPSGNAVRLTARV